MQRLSLTSRHTKLIAVVPYILPVIVAQATIPVVPPSRDHNLKILSRIDFGLLGFIALNIADVAG